MLRHIVMWKLKEQAEGADRVTNAQRMKELLESCATLPGVVKYEVALAQPGLEATYDIVLYSVFRDKASLDAYQGHPQHLAIKPFIGAVRLERQCMDYEV